MVSNKIERLVNYLVQKNEFVTVSQISDDLGFSVRSIHTYLNSTYFISLTTPALLEKIPNKGIYLNVTNQQKHIILSKLQKRTRFSATVSDDVLKIVMWLLVDQIKLDTNSLSKRLFRSESGVQRLLKDVQRYVEPFSCELATNRHSGFYIKGDEKDVRSLFLFSLKKLKDNERIYYHSRLSAHTQYMMQSFLDENEEEFLLKCVENVEKATTYFCDTDYNLLILHLIIILVRVKENHMILIDNDIVIALPEYQSAMLLSIYFKKYFNVALNDDEIRYLALIIISLRKQVNSIPIIKEHLILNKFIQSLSYKLNTDLNNDEQLKQNLLTHLRPTMERLKLKTYSKNPILNHIKNEYTDVFISVMTTIEELEKNDEVFFDANEIGYICLHIIASLHKPDNSKKFSAALLCNEGLSLEQYFKNLIESLFTSTEVKKIIRLQNTSEMIENEYDVVFNTTNLFIDKPNTFTISANISDFEVNRINLFLNSITKRDLANDLMANNLLLFFKDTITTQTDLLKKYSQYLYEFGYVQSGFYQSVITRQKISSTYISRGIAVPHGSAELVDRSVIVIIILDNPIAWDNEEAQIILFIVSNNEHAHSFNQLLRSILRVASSDPLTKQLLECNNKKEVIHILSKS